MLTIVKIELLHFCVQIRMKKKIYILDFLKKKKPRYFKGIQSLNSNNNKSHKISDNQNYRKILFQNKIKHNNN